jgi:hypothetical protein
MVTGASETTTKRDGMRRIDVVAELRREFPYVQDEGWVLKVADEEGWAEANRRYLSWQRDRGRLEMAALMDAFGTSEVQSPAEACALVKLAYSVFMPIDRFRGQISQLRPDTIRVSIEVCPTYDKIEEAGWRGVTACGSWHHRHGWYDAMGVDAEDSLIAEKKWGEPACVSEITFSIPDRETTQTNPE